jgi:hypothetical protein
MKGGTIVFGVSKIEVAGLDNSFLCRWQPVSLVTAKDEEESARAGRRVRARMKQCWFNARKVVLQLADYRNASYVEGCCITKSGMLLEHGWVVRDHRSSTPPSSSL